MSLVEQVLQRDPAGVYARMDFRSRDRYRHAIEELADPTGSRSSGWRWRASNMPAASLNGHRTRAARTSGIT